LGGATSEVTKNLPDFRAFLNDDIIFNLLVLI